jgi:SAM-dependent methyltransferase
MMPEKGMGDPVAASSRGIPWFIRLRNRLWCTFVYSALGPAILSRFVPNRVEVGRTFPQDTEAFAQSLEARGVPVKRWSIDVSGYWTYVTQARYHDFPYYYQNGRAPALVEKTVEHYVAAELLDLSPNDIYVDIASANSPVPDILRQTVGCAVFRQDLIYPPGLNGDTIGGDATHMPVPDGFATKMALHCSFEHFEDDSDVGFIREAARVLRKGGKLCILPLYVAEHYAILTDPVTWVSSRPQFERDAVLYLWKGWGQRHGRFYDVEHFMRRVIQNLNGLRLSILCVDNAKDVDKSCYLRLAALFERI